MALRLTFRLPGWRLAAALLAAMSQALADDWRSSGLAQWFTARPRPAGFTGEVRDFRSVAPEAAHTLLEGAGGNPWDRPSPSRAFAVALHRFDWLAPLLTTEDPAGGREALRLVLDWRRTFGRWNRFSWSPDVMTRRVVNLACAGGPLTERASQAEALLIAATLANQARSLLRQGGPADLAARAAAAAIAGVALDGVAGRRLLERALRKLGPALDTAVEADGGHRTRRADAALDLLLDLMTLVAALQRRGSPPSEVIHRAMDRLSAAVRFFTLADGALSAQQGGSPRTAAYVAAASSHDQIETRAAALHCNGFHRLDSPALQVVVDCAPPPVGPWSLASCAQPMGLEVLAAGRRLIAASSGRTLNAATALMVGDREIARPLSGFVGRALGEQLVGGAIQIEVQRHEGPGAVWLDIENHGWLKRFGVLHQRRLFLDTTLSELRGEDRLTPTAKAQGPDGRHFVPYTLRFQLEPEVRALVSQDRRSVLLRLAGASRGWILRNDILDIEVEPSRGPRRPSQQIVLRGQRRADSGARVRWKLGPAARARWDQTESSDPIVLDKFELEPVFSLQIVPSEGNRLLPDPH